MCKWNWTNEYDARFVVLFEIVSFFLIEKLNGCIIISPRITNQLERYILEIKQ